jgi:L-cystine transport system substrate-binding protein
MRLFNVLSVLLVLSPVLGGCGNADNNIAAGGPSASAAADPADVTKIIVGTGTAFPKVCFLDENGKLTGFDVELLKEIDSRLPQYEFELRTMEFTNLLLSLDTKKIDLVAHVMEKNPEREQKYLFNKEPYAHWRNRIVVAKDNNSQIATLDDLQGKKALVGATSAEAQILENYNKQHKNAITLVYHNGGANDTVSQLTSGRADATLSADFVLPVIDPEGKLKAVGDPLSSADILYILRKGEPESQQLADAIDTAVKELKADGTLGKLSQEWLGADVTETLK